MYRLGESERSHRKFYIFLLIFILLVAGAIAGAFRYLKADTKIATPAAPVTTQVTYDSARQVMFDTPLFSISLPEDWKPTTRSNDIPQPKYTWQGTVRDNANRWVSIYVDQPVSNVAVNRAVTVQAGAGTLNVLGDVSDNCTTFTGNVNQGTGVTPAKWQGNAFICDSGNYERDVVGIVSSDGLNNINVTGAQGGHKFFITYTDNSVSPDYTIFKNALKTIKIK